MRADREWARYAWAIAKQGPTELGYAYFRARRRKRNKGDDEPTLTESDLLALTGGYDVDVEALDANARVLEEYRDLESLDVRTIQWFLPFFHHAYFGGVHTILRFADRWAREHGVENRFCIYDAPGDEAQILRIAGKIAEAFPALDGVDVSAAARWGEPPFSHLPDCDAAIATLWTSAYPLMRFQRTKAKFFFLQDYEPLFYPAGSASALVEQTYSLRFPGIVNTPGLAEVYRSYGNEAVSFLPAVDTQRYHPPEEPRAADPVRIFFYARPGTPRNAFGLGLAALAKVKARYGDRVDIVCAGEEWTPGQYGVAGRIRNLGRLATLEEVAELYRTCHIGLVFMLTRHPSYQPFEFMASGVATVSNENPHTAWFLRHRENAMLARPAPSLVADTIGELIEDPALRERIAATALREVSAVRWEDQIDRVWSTITKTGGAFDDAQLPVVPLGALRRA